jgi:hypothetical protein
VRAGLLADLVGRVAQLARRTVGAVGDAIQGLGEEPRCGLVAALGQRDADLARGAAVELRGPPGARPGPALTGGGTRDEQAVLDEPVEVERGEGS